MMRGMVINMEEAKLCTLAQVKAVLDGTAEVAFRVPKEERKFVGVLGLLSRRNLAKSTHWASVMCGPASSCLVQVSAGPALARIAACLQRGRISTDY